MNKLLLIIDPQNDFVDRKGSLYVPGSQKAIKNICEFIKTRRIDNILLSQDTHQKYNICFPDFWNNPDLKPFDKIPADSVRDGLISPKNPELQKNDWWKKYISRDITLWPYHCIEGSWGCCFPNILIDTLGEWSLKNNKTYRIHKKGYIPELESYSIFPQHPDLPEPPVYGYDKIYVAGFCKDICVFESVVGGLCGLYGKIVFLDNCMTALDPQSPNLEIYDWMVKARGAKIENV